MLRFLAESLKLRGTSHDIAECVVFKSLFENKIRIKSDNSFFESEHQLRMIPFDRTLAFLLFMKGFKCVFVWSIELTPRVFLCILLGLTLMNV